MSKKKKKSKVKTCPRIYSKLEQLQEDMDLVKENVKPTLLKRIFKWGRLVILLVIVIKVLMMNDVGLTQDQLITLAQTIAESLQF